MNNNSESTVSTTKRPHKKRNLLLGITMLGGIAIGATLVETRKSPEEIMASKRKAIIEVMNQELTKEGVRFEDEKKFSCMISILGNSSGIEAILACNGEKVLSKYIPKSTSDFITQIHNIDIKNNTLNPEGGCMIIEEDGEAVSEGMCIESDLPPPLSPFLMKGKKIST